MAEFTGANLVINWFPSSGGTINLSGDMRSVAYQPSGKLANATAGSDAFESYLGTVKDTKVSYTGVMASAGTAMEDALLPNTFGTLIIGPEGTAAGKRKYTIPAFAGGAKFDWKFSDTVEVSCDFQGSGSPTLAVY